MNLYASLNLPVEKKALVAVSHHEGQILSRDKSEVIVKTAAQRMKTLPSMSKRAVRANAAFVSSF
jgi:hypothetical protein